MGFKEKSAEITCRIASIFDTEARRFDQKAAMRELLNKLS